MSRLQDASPEILDILSSLCNDEATQADVQRLEECVGQDHHAIALILDYLQLHSDLYFELMSRSASSSLLHDIESAGKTILPESIGIPVLDLHSSPSQSTAPYLLSGWPVAYLIATIIITIGLAIGAVTHVDQPAQISYKSSSALKGEPSPTVNLLQVGRITGMVGCQWRDSKTEAFNGASVFVGRKYVLASGLMEITYNTGAKVILQGPCTYEVDSPAGGYLEIGKLTARVEKRGERREEREEDAANYQVLNPRIPKSPNPSLAANHYPRTANSNPQSPIPNPLFTVRTPSATITDLGTEFGVEVRPDMGVETHVFVGMVMVTPAGNGDKQILRAGSALRLSGNNASPSQIAVNDKQFVRIMPPPVWSQASDDYAAMVLAMRPVAYYRMERPLSGAARGMVFDSASEPHSGALHPANKYGQPWYIGCFGDSLRLRGPNVPDFAVVTDCPTAPKDSLSVSAWAYAESRPYGGTIIAQVPDRFHLGLCRDGGDLSVGVARRDGQQIHIREGTSKPFPLNQWQHVAFVVDNSILRLYRNGILVGEQPCDGLSFDMRSASLLIGCRNLPSDKGSALHYWHGRIDEVAIFHSALSNDDILRLSQPPENAQQKTERR